MAVLLLGTFDTKGEEYTLVRDLIAEGGQEVILLDTGVLGTPSLEVDVTAETVAGAGGGDLAELRRTRDRGAALRVMAAGASAVALELQAGGRLSGVLALGGSGGSAIAAAVMRGLPVGLPKLLVSTMASGDVSAYVGESDVTLMYSVVDIAGINSISRQILGNAAAAMGAMAAAYEARGEAAEVSDRPLVAATMFGVTTPAVETARARLERHGYEVLVFHATGSGGRAMEALAASGYFAGVLDLTTTELADELVGGVLSAGPERLTAAGRAGIPQVVGLGALDMVNFGPMDTVPERFRDRRLLVHNEAVTLMRTTPAENAELGALLGGKLAAATGPVALYVSRGGVSAVDVEGGPFWDPPADAALFEAVRQAVADTSVELVESDDDINAAAFATAAADHLHRLIQEEKAS
ncbi:Tm-1-like ATP-binding domain-containing protein [Spongiactinospora sp. TRM90649]|uniref:Tm-1-like ATP-binding domain-containing protein n=1 Tax=Spongiactinospora sp. TRM90649 TaxID=3031114 RepID=UPI0023F6F3AD|nr:Tm-1-like ATP-binding domain-containing protein [Spongiactinospora sp. TRM90649]MDF5759171.1 Tm-1-like ATP-binding domain-containing protein [Spongiactinospora sp. TRM90649]